MRKNKLAVGCELFSKGFVVQALDSSTISLGLGIGIMQGLKYNGNFKRGLTTGLVVMGVVSTVNGLRNVIENAYIIKEF